MPSIVSVNLSVSDTSLYPLGENYRWIITWVADAVTYVTTVHFDVVREPFTNRCGLSDLCAEVSDMQERLTRQAAASDTALVRSEWPARLEVRYGASGFLLFYPKPPLAAWATVTGTPTYVVKNASGTTLASGNCTVTAVSSTASKTAADQAALYTAHAWMDCEVLLQALMADRGWVRSRLIIDQEKIRRVVAAFAISRAYRAEGGGRDSESRALAEEWAKEAQQRFAALAPVSYDADDDGTPESELSGFASSQMVRRW